MCPAHLVVQSADRQSGSSSDFRVQIPTFSRCGSVALLSASIPNTLYNINETNDTLSWYNVETLKTATIPHGAYGVTDLIAVLTEYMNDADPGNTYTVSYSPVTMKITVDADPEQISLALSEGDALWRVLGFTAGITTYPSYSHTGDSVLRLDFPAYLYIDIGLPAADVVNTAWTRANYIVPMENISQYVQVYNRSATFDQLQCYSLGAGVSTLNVRLMRPDGTLADLNGGDWSFVLGIEHPAW